jgi:hypothetical protein
MQARTARSVARITLSMDGRFIVACRGVIRTRPGGIFVTLSR